MIGCIPQIAPLIWNIIFLTTSLILLVVLTKTFFILGKKEISDSTIREGRGFNIINKTWIW